MNDLETPVFIYDGSNHKVDPNALPDAIIPEFLSETDVADFVRRAIAHCQVKRNFDVISHEPLTTSSNMPALGLIVSNAGLETAVSALDLLAPVVNPIETSWYGAIDKLATLATEQGIDFADELNL
ncbi:MAG: hypothetical protein ACXWLH_01820 [Candidatus Saccharimonadales bacterium]